MLLETTSAEATVYHILTSQCLCSEYIAYVSKNLVAPKAINLGLQWRITSQESEWMLSIREQGRQKGQ